MKLLQEKFAELDGQTITTFTMVNDQGMEVSTIDYGCTITRIVVPDRNGTLENVVLGFDTIEEYQQHSPYFGAVVGRHAGRIANAEFTLEGTTYHLAKNNNDNHLHGGIKGLDKVIWNTEVVEEKDSLTLVFTYLSKDGEEGYPGNLKMKISYTLNNDNELQISYEGVSDQKTVVNVTNHSYFNLSGNLKRDVLNHKLTLKSNRFLELDEELIPTGEILPVENTSFDFRSGRKIIEGTDTNDSQNIIAGNGYDHPFLLTDNHNKEIYLFDDESGRGLIIETNQPAVVLYTGNQLADDFSIRGINSRKYLGLCLETQGLPDSLNHPHFPSAILEKDQGYYSVTKYIFTN
ncbi:galactose-1-epimerase [Bacillus sp. AFS073361]|uniref:aldose epimerase family protein n=1 Tax=Bacillus sp. AFS073361 TaxID=2033511 RepID=UPI000BF75641|nr:aldose epimerase family protein [Bacillus sp. AFS073361]PFP31365.1 galactose-1-epimerase [Bacillus sp. AFS073361]